MPLWWDRSRMSNTHFERTVQSNSATLYRVNAVVVVVHQQLERQLLQLQNFQLSSNNRIYIAVSHEVTLIPQNGTKTAWSLVTAED